MKRTKDGSEDSIVWELPMVVRQGPPPSEVSGVNTLRRLDLQQVGRKRVDILQRGDPVRLANLPRRGVLIDRVEKWIGNPLMEAELPREVIGGIQLEALVILGELEVAA